MFSSNPTPRDLPLFLSLHEILTPDTKSPVTARLHDAPPRHAMAVCKFFLQGNCKFGDRCKFDHPGAQNQLRGNQQNQNRYAPLNNANTGGQAARGPQRGPRHDFKYNLDPDIVHVDLTSDRPIWPFSVYAPGRTAPRHLIEGPVMEQSPEEMRLRYYAAMRTGTPQEAVS
ncbi:Nucleoporin-like protein 2 [Diplodia intermedia]|uniref:Nucleoporin-like protein 2 n=1 Tax=Diplodia intermedia TaxID=856260 RepID=A0ABR3TRA3_9PEZI